MWNVYVYKKNSPLTSASFDLRADARSYVQRVRRVEFLEWLYQFDELSPSPSISAYRSYVKETELKFSITDGLGYTEMDLLSGIHRVTGDWALPADVVYYRPIPYVSMPRWRHSTLPLTLLGDPLPVPEKTSLLARFREWLGLD